MVCYEFKGGTGTASRRLAATAGGYTVGVLVQCNCGRRDFLRIAAVPVGRELQSDKVYSQVNAPGGVPTEDTGSIIIVVATDAPLLTHQLKRLARRATLGLARTGSISGNGSGDIFIAFSTANPGSAAPAGLRHLDMLPNDQMDPLFEATVEATEEAVVNAMVGAQTMTGINNHTVEALPHDKLQEVLKKYNRLGH
jgi:L-aminopeptidase/D-esterase-like protein